MRLGISAFLLPLRLSNKGIELPRESKASGLQIRIQE
jgi:hypothetical protein